MADLLSRVIIGNMVIHASTLRKFFKKSHYYMSYKPEKMLISFHANDGDGGLTLFEIRSASYESAVKLAQELGLSSNMEMPTLWTKWNPIYSLWHDGSNDAEKLRVEMLRLGMPFHLFKNSQRTDTNGVAYWGWSPGETVYTPPSFNTESVLKIIHEEAERYKELLASTP